VASSFPAPDADDGCFELIGQVLLAPVALDAFLPQAMIGSGCMICTHVRVPRRVAFPQKSSH